jgi:RES domain
VADFNGKFHDLRLHADVEDCLNPNSYLASQLLAERLLAEGSLGIAYPSVHHPGGECLVCFRPALVTNVRKSTTYRFRWEGKVKPIIEPIKR